MPFTEWDEPCSAKEAFTRRRMLIADIEEIQMQLSFRRWQRSADATTRSSYWSWQPKAIAAWTNKKQELRYIKEWIYENEAFEDEPETGRRAVLQS